MSRNVKRLFADLKPTSYNIKLDLDIKNMTFEGHVDLNAKITKRPSKRITLHQKNLNFSKARVFLLKNNQKEEIEVLRINKQAKFDEVRIHFKELIYPGEYLISIDYGSSITATLNGIYPSYYNHRKDIILATQFESHFAREAFPCIDEPEAKAVFKLSLITDKFNSYISNTDIESQKTVKGRVHTSFLVTPKMSTYLVAFVIGNFDFSETYTRDQKRLRVYSVHSKEQTLFALEVAKKTLEFYEDYFAIKYPLNKCDFIAMPDFASGAMENWGCIIFREHALLIDPNQSTLFIKQYVASVIAHELTHQWFGNLVTMKWWNDLWLNESFATFMSYVAVNKLFPKWEIWKSFIIEEQFVAMNLDQLLNTHPIQVKINHPDEIKSIFDSISYEKGASVLMMLEDYLGSKTFMQGIQKYLKKYEYGNCETLDLWTALSNVSDKNVEDFMSKWISLSGFP